eukprot:Amastigsp_a842449_4.p4 type:complete len:103 gc:universal Amastigsp_a842449_4:237-545(+)
MTDDGRSVASVSLTKARRAFSKKGVLAASTMGSKKCTRTSFLSSNATLFSSDCSQTLVSLSCSQTACSIRHDLAVGSMIQRPVDMDPIGIRSPLSCSASGRA